MMSPSSKQGSKQVSAWAMYMYLLVCSTDDPCYKVRHNKKNVGQLCTHLCTCTTPRRLLNPLPLAFHCVLYSSDRGVSSHYNTRRGGVSQTTDRGVDVLCRIPSARYAVSMSHNTAAEVYCRARRAMESHHPPHRDEIGMLCSYCTC